MKSLMLLAAATVALTLGGCQVKEAAVPAVGAKLGPGGRGRFVAVGLYQPGQMWTQLAPPATPQGAPPVDPAAATLEDDEQIVVVLDSASGELRQCGNFSGHCIAMNAWSAPATGAPAALVKPAQQLAADWEQAHPATDVEVRVKKQP